MDHETRFSEAVEELRAEARCRVRAPLERVAGRNPYAVNQGPEPDEVFV